VAASDGTLVLGVLAGDRAALGELYDRRAPLIRAICFDATRELDLAAELTQEVFLRAIQKLPGLRDPQRFASWLVGIARQVCREWRRAQRRRRRWLRPLDEQDCAHPIDAAPDERLALLREVLPALPERERLSLQAFYLSGLDAEQARTVLGLPLSTFYRVLAQAREHLAAVLRQQEVRP
jgi:RNA polymerase sigma-70 factor (ECF subfamily)